MSFSIEGKIIKIGETETKGDNFQIRELVIETSGQYPQKVRFQLVKDKTTELDKYSLDQPEEVYFNIRGNEWNEKFYVNLDCWRIEAKANVEHPAPKGFQNEPKVLEDMPF